MPRGGALFGADLKLAVSSRRGRKADLSMYLPGRPLPGRLSGATKRAPSVAIEILSPDPRDVRRDVVEKKSEYAAFGVAFYWIVDPGARRLEIFELDANAQYTVALSASEGQHGVPGCEGLVIDLDTLWHAGDAPPRGRGRPTPKRPQARG